MQTRLEVDPDFLNMPREELLRGQPAAPTPAAPSTLPPAEGPDFLAMPREDLQKLPPPPTPGGFWSEANQRGGSLATGMNERLADVLGSPFDLTAYLLNKGHAYLNAPKLSDLVTKEAGGTPKPWVDPNPTLGSEWWKRRLDDTVGRTEPKDALDKILHATGGGITDAVVALGTGGALSAAGRAPRTAQALMGGGPDKLSVASNLTAGAGSGAGSEIGGQAAAALSDNDPAWTSLGRTIGGFGGGFAGAVTPATVLNVGQGLRAVARPLTQRGDELLAGRTLNEATENPWAVRAQLTDSQGRPVPQDNPLGINPTLGQQTNDPNLLQLERGVQQMSPANAGRFGQLAGENNQVVRQSLDQLGNPAGATPGDISATAMPGLEAQRAAAKEAERAAWQAVDPTNTVLVPMPPIRQRLQNFLSSLTMADRHLVPDDLIQMFQRDFGGSPNLPLREVQSIRSDLLGRQRAAAAARQENEARVLSEIDRAVFPGIDPGVVELPPGVSQAVRDRHAEARALTRQYHAEYNQPPIRDIVGRGSTPDSAGFEKIFTSAPGQRERVAQFISASRGDPELLQAGRNWFTARLGERMSSAIAQDTQGQPQVLGASLTNFINQNRALVNSELFTADQRRVINEMVDAVGMLARTQSAGKQFGGSSTAANLASDNYVKALVGSWAKPVIGAASAIGAGLAGHQAGGGILAALAAPAGAGVGYRLADSLYSSAGERVKVLLAQAMTDPAFAAELMGRASRANMQFASPRLQSMLSTVPATVYGR